MNYEELLEKARETYESEDTPHVVKAWLLANIIGPADENEDERIRKGIIRNLQFLMDRSEGFVKEDLQERIAWLEEQGKHANTRININENKTMLNACINALRIVGHSHLADWLEKQKSNTPKREIDDAYLQGISDAKHAIEKQGESTRINIEIPFGANDSELQEVSYYIPEGFHAEIKDDRVVIKKVERKFKVGGLCGGIYIALADKK